MKTPFIHLVQNTWFPEHMCGWGNGYVNLPKGHKYYGVYYDEIPVDVHGGLTFSEQIGEYWTVGFDTAHSGDTSNYWTFDKVYEETVNLLEQLL